MASTAYLIVPTRLEVAYVFTFSILVFVYQIYNTVYKTFETLPRHRSINTSLLIHIFVGYSEILRYYILMLSKRPIHTETLDLIFMFIHTGTSFHLAKAKGKIGNGTILRPIYHSQALFRVVLTTLAYTQNFANLHRASIMINASFLYPRILIYIIVRLRVLTNYSDMYTASMFISALLAMHDSGITMGPQIWLATFMGIIILERWVAYAVIER